MLLPNHITLIAGFASFDARHKPPLRVTYQRTSVIVRNEIKMAARAR